MANTDESTVNEIVTWTSCSAHTTLRGTPYHRARHARCRVPKLFVTRAQRTLSVTSNAATTEDTQQPTLPGRAMPTLVVCTAAGFALVIAVGLQAPAVSVGIRWTAGPRSRTLQGIPPELSSDMERASSGPPDSSWPSWLIWGLAALAAAVMLFAIVRWLLRITRRRPATTVARTGADTGVPTEAEARILQSGLVAAIEILATERDPGNAVVQAWQGLQDAAATAGLHRRPAETTSEFTARILYRSRGSAAPIAVMLSLYQQVRFGEHVPAADEITAARNSLAVLVELWRADFPARRPTGAAR